MERGVTGLLPGCYWVLFFVGNRKKRQIMRFTKKRSWKQLSSNEYFTGFDWVWLGLTGFDWVWLGFTRDLGVLLGLAGFYWVLLGFGNGFDWVWMSLTGFQWVKLGLSGIWYCNRCRWWSKWMAEPVFFWARKWVVSSTASSDDCALLTNNSSWWCWNFVIFLISF